VEYIYIVFIWIMTTCSLVGINQSAGTCVSIFEKEVKLE